MMALFPVLMNDEEFSDNFELYRDQFSHGFSDLPSATEYMAMLCDNAYRRIKDASCSAAVKVSVDKAGNLMRVSQVQLDSGAFEPTHVIAGEFTIFAKQRGLL